MMQREHTPEQAALRVRTYGQSGPDVVLLHGGPGAPGYMAPVARRISASFRVHEPLQRGSSRQPLTVASHVADLHGHLATLEAQENRPMLVGHSWGAMLALAYAATHHQAVASLVLIGCGTFNLETRQRMASRRRDRMDDDLKRDLSRLSREIPDENDRLGAMGDLLLRSYSFDPVETSLEMEKCDARAYHESWDDMMRLQETGVYPASFAHISIPVLMLHGDVDPHPGHMIRESLKPHLPQLIYHEMKDCGHYPWLEKNASREFFITLTAWLNRQSPPWPTTLLG